MKMGQLFACVLFAGSILLVVVSSINSDDPRDVARLQLALQSLPQAAGIFVSAAASFLMLIKAIDGGNLEQLSVFVLPLFAGVLLLQVHWAPAVALGLIALGFVIGSILNLVAQSRNEHAV